MKNRLLVAIVFSQLFAGMAFAEKFERNGHFGSHDFGMPNIYRRLDLSKNQRMKIQEIFYNNHGKNNQEEDFDEQQKMMQKMHLLIQSDKLDEVALQRLAEERGKSVKTRFIQMVKTEHQIWLLLTPQQRQKVQKILQKRQQHFKKRLHKYQKHWQDNAP